jgi:predicted ATP-dependent protease
VLITYLNRHDSKAFNDEERNEIASSYVWILWFSKDSKDAVIKLYDFLFSKTEHHTWKEATKKLIDQNLILPIINPELIKKQLTEIVIKSKIQYNDFNTIQNQFLPEIKKQLFYDAQNESIFNENWSLLIEKIYKNKSMLIYAQKEYMNTKFKEFNQFENLDDTNRPWDWDHIYPDSWVYQQKGINILVRKWVNCIGNFRALSYDDNRSENNHLSPKERFENDTKKSESFISQDNLTQWNEMNQKFGRIKENEPEKTEKFLDAVISRMIDIYQEWLFNYYQS